MRAADEKKWALWAKKAVDLLKAADAPTMQEASQMSDVTSAEQAVLGSVRASTLQSRVRPWASFVKWLSWRKDKMWPTETSDIFDFLAERQREVPLGTFPRAFRAALRWFEARSGLDEERKLGNKDIVKRLLDKAVPDGAEALGEVRKAPRFPIALVVSLEQAVMAGVTGDGIAKTKAIVAWMRLVKLFGAMRSDDLQRVHPDSVTFGDAGMVMKLLRTKTSGPGKRTRELMAFIPTDTGISSVEWLAAGYRLWRTVAVDGAP